MSVFLLLFIFRRNTKTQILGSVELNGRSVRALVLVISIALEGDSDVEYATFCTFSSVPRKLETWLQPPIC